MLDKKAYTEVFYIINEMSEDLKKKIPNKIIKNIENKMDKNYDFCIKDDVKNIEILEDTEKILSVLYTDYFTTDEERRIIKGKEEILNQKNKPKLQNIKINEIFDQNKEKEKSKKLILVQKEKWHTKILNFFKRFWNN